jgi:AcrR family transcriptional regulator
MTRQAHSQKLPRHRHQLSRETVQNAQQSRILRAAAEAVADKGYRAATVADIVRRAGVSTKTFYEIYADKEAALCAVYDAVDEVIERFTGREVPRHSDPRALLHAAVSFTFARLAADPTFTRVLIVEAVGAGPRIQARRNQAFRRMAALIAEALRPSHPAGIDEKLIIAYLGGLTELALQHVADAPIHTLPVLTEAACRFTDAVFFPNAR